MAIKVVWTRQALNGLDRVIAYLEDEWTAKEIQTLEQKIHEFILRITKYPEINPKTDKFKNTFKGLVDKNNYIVYRIHKDKELIEIINFRGTKQKPEA